MKPTLRVALAIAAASLGGLLSASPVLADTWADRCAKNNITCVDIAVSSVDKTITLDEPALLKQNKGKIIWRLPEGYVFNHKPGSLKSGGVYVADQDEVISAEASGDDDENTSKLTRRFRIQSKTLGADRNYTLIFDEMNGGKPTRRFTCDPTIANSHSILSVGERGKVKAAATLTSSSLTKLCDVTTNP